MSGTIPPTDLTQRPPRSVRCRLGGFALLPRIIDKGRALGAGTNGEFSYACPLDMEFFEFTAIDPQAFKKQIETGPGDGELLAWVGQNSGTKRRAHEIALWSRYMEDRVPSDSESRELFQGIHKSAAGSRADIGTWFDPLDLDDYASFGGKA